MVKSIFLSTLCALCLMASAAAAERICPLDKIGAGAFVPLVTCASDRCPQIMALAADQEVKVLTTIGAWIELEVQNNSGQLVTGFAQTKFICP
jgi:hypothetical protein